ncbi:MAG: hypothetical protein IT305_22230 [Chloroflexi bacterium]|nr:hypothetical protein [Chloroflexota bacterium]
MEHLAQRLGASAHADTIFGDPVERDGTTVIPVGRARWGFGGGWGSGRGPETASDDREAAARAVGEGSGGGGGGGLTVSPIGYIEIANGQTRFHPIYDPMALMRFVFIGGLIGFALSRIGRRS